VFDMESLAAPLLVYNEHYAYTDQLRVRTDWARSPLLYGSTITDGADSPIASTHVSAPSVLISTKYS
jgi:hypothetical protein